MVALVLGDHLGDLGVVFICWYDNCAGISVTVFYFDSFYLSSFLLIIPFILYVFPWQSTSCQEALAQSGNLYLFAPALLVIKPCICT